MSHSDAILQRVMGLHPKVIDLSLDRLMRLLDALGNPQDQLPPVVHIAGTNGKGSTLAMIRAGLEAAGKRVHAYTSPHLARFHERIRLAGALIPEDELSALLTEIEAVNAGQPITFFELTTAAAFLAFSGHEADYTLLEVGLGGRLDATNVVARPALTVITPVSIDHTQFLGDTLAQIAGEKAGIIKRGVPLVVSPQQDEALQVIEARATRLGAPLIVAGQHWHAAPEPGGMVFQDDHGLIDLPLPNLAGPHQVENAGTAIAALRALGFGAAEALAAVTKAEWPARMQRLGHGRLVEIAQTQGCELWLDGGHNAAGGQAIAATLAAMPKRPVHLICGMLNTKDVAGYLRPLARVAQSLTAVSIPGEENTLPAEATKNAAASVGLQATTSDDVADAVQSLATAHPGARLLICGSLYLAGQVLRDNG
ncbi:folylpolyglutamate synthase/dihydrofolate synthase family protein [Paracoccus sp. SCSIO 75233]|uniref:bifunctional folylpolyglutamate synthase/dihydrofolate synthase n=1 Tax=Paracoccus sp. SCSIO 75233 TaxID=3017782 RepID=UPI0022F0B378|nr:folylpolyglutamate synthase/dihydrofolate synthase family protein [Paracoccus sp. SCSIO 75233]WBU54042.1 bifunctional folylpolyglutamate synthase/dihydrofolate synthase [Paracoccus sp. SCSIO 75233]